MSKAKINILIISLFIIAGISGIYLVFYYSSLKKDQDEFTKLATTIYEEKSKAQIDRKKEELNSKEEEVDKDQELIDGIKILYDLNNDLVGWLKIEGSRINYPIMYTPNNPEYYLKRNFNKEYSISGVPFIDKNSSVDPFSDNILIHGHNMKNGSMFADLLLYKEESHFIKYPNIDFYTKEGKEIFEIISVYPTELYNEKNVVFDYQTFVNYKDEEDFNNYLNKIKKVSLYDTGVEGEYGDKFITLSTCAYHKKNGRFVIIGRKK